IGPCDELEGILRTTLHSVAGVQECPRNTIHREQAIVVRRAAQRIIPLEETGQRGAGRHVNLVPDGTNTALKVVKPRRARAVRLLDVLERVVACGGEVRDARLNGAPDRRRCGAVLEERLVEERYVIDDNGGPRPAGS